VPGGGHRTFAEMTSQEKNQASRRRLAVQALRDGLGLA
jgi:inosine/xanthosine triphosphate pyrophosphatase family protein